MLDELTKSIKAQLYERASSPLLASFGIAWLAWNYRFVLVLLGSESYSDKFAYIDAHIFSNCKQTLLIGLAYPLTTALFMLFVYPVPAKFVYRYWREQQRELKEIQKQIDDETPLTREEAKEIRQAALKAALEYEAQIQKQSEENARLKDLIRQSQYESNDSQIKKRLASNRASTDLKLDDVQLEILKMMAKTDDRIREAELLNKIPVDRVKANYHLQELVDMNLVERRGDIVVLTHMARDFLINRGCLVEDL